MRRQWHQSLQELLARPGLEIANVAPLVITAAVCAAERCEYTSEPSVYALCGYCADGLGGLAAPARVPPSIVKSAPVV